jgi:purine nucleoside permease
MLLGSDPRLDLTQTYFIMAGIAGVDPNRPSVGSAAWAQWVVDGDNVNEIDGHDAPKEWPYGILPYGGLVRISRLDLTIGVRNRWLSNSIRVWCLGHLTFQKMYL